MQNPQVLEYSKLAKGKEAFVFKESDATYLTNQGFAVDTAFLRDEYYHLIVSTYALDRSLFSAIENALKEGGILILESYMHHNNNLLKSENQKLFLQEGELEATFDDRYELLHIQEWWDDEEKVMKASMVAKKKAGGVSLDDFWA